MSYELLIIGFSSENFYPLSRCILLAISSKAFWISSCFGVRGGWAGAGCPLNLWWVLLSNGLKGYLLESSLRLK